MIYVDGLEQWGAIIGYHGNQADHAAAVGARNNHMWCHLFADEADCEELHRFAANIGLRRTWFQGDHYDITPSKRQLAVARGAREVTRVEAVMIWRRRRGATNMPIKINIQRVHDDAMVPWEDFGVCAGCGIELTSARAVKEGDVVRHIGCPKTQALREQAKPKFKLPPLPRRGSR